VGYIKDFVENFKCVQVQYNHRCSKLFFNEGGTANWTLQFAVCVVLKTKKVFTLQYGLLFLCSHYSYLLHKITSTTLCALFKLLTVLLEYLDLL